MKRTYYNGRLTVNKEVGKPMAIRAIGLNEGCEATDMESAEIGFDFGTNGYQLTDNESELLYNVIQGWA